MSKTPDTARPVSTAPRPLSASGMRRPATDDPITRPLTDPADLFTLLGRFMATVVLFMMTVAFLVNDEPSKRVFAIPFGTVTLLVQFAAIRLWRRLRDERLAAKEARAQAIAERTAAAGEVL